MGFAVHLESADGEFSACGFPYEIFLYASWLPGTPETLRSPLSAPGWLSLIPTECGVNTCVQFVLVQVSC